jgi:phosphoglycolate phosphatase
MYPILLFDLDGTLTDPKPGITKCVQYALRKMGIEEPDCDRLTPFIGPPLVQAFKEFYHMDDQQANEAIKHYRERFSTVGLYENSVYPGIHELLEQLKSQGRRLLVATSKPTVFSVTILEYFGIRGFFSEVVGSNLDGSRVNKGEVIAFALSQIGTHSIDQVVMIGDRKHDVLGAKENSLDSIAVGYGYGTREELFAAGPTFMMQTVEELRQFLR